MAGKSIPILSYTLIVNDFACVATSTVWQKHGIPSLAHWDQISRFLIVTWIMKSVIIEVVYLFELHCFNQIVNVVGNAKWI